MHGIKETIRMALPKPLLFIYRLCKRPQDIAVMGGFLVKPNAKLPFIKRLSLTGEMCRISTYVECVHTQEEASAYMDEIISMPSTLKGCVVEAGCYKGGSTAKFSLATKIAGRKLFVFDSFEGIPDNDEMHEKNIFGGRAAFPQGSWRGSLEEVKNAVEKYGDIDTCEFVKGWFKETLPYFKEPIAAAYLDVDLAASTRTCLKYLYPLLAAGGVLYSHDGHLPLVIEVFNDDEFWKNEIGCKKPHVEGLGKKKLIRIVKPGI
jgi:O-methyltransferase